MENYHRLPVSPERPTTNSSNNHINSDPIYPFSVRPLPQPRPNASAGPSNYQGNNVSVNSNGKYPSSLSAEEVRRNSSNSIGGAGQGNNPSFYRTVHMRDGSGGSITSPPARAHSPLPPPRNSISNQQQYTNSYPQQQQYQTQPPTPLSIHPSSLPLSHNQSTPYRPQAHSNPLPPGTVCTATVDHESLSVVNLSNLTSVAAVKERILAKLHIGDDEFFACSFYLTKIGGPEGRRINDEELWEICWSAGTEGKSLVIFVKQSNGPSPHTPLEDFGNSAQTMTRYRDERSYTSNTAPSPTSAAANSVANLRRSSNNRSPTNSSRSDVSSHLGHVMLDNAEYSPIGGDRRGSWLPHSNSGGGYGSGSPENLIGGSGSGGHLSPPGDSRGRSSQGSLTPTAPEDYWTEQQSHQLQQQHQQQSRRPSAPAAMVGNRVMSPPIPPLPPTARRLPTITGSSSRNPSPHDESRRTQTIPAPTLSSNLNVQSNSQQNWQRPVPTYQPPPPQFARPLPAADPRGNHPQYQYSSVPSPAPEYHNLSLQGSYQQQLYQQQQQAPPMNPAYTNYEHHSPNLQHQASFSNLPLAAGQQGRTMNGSKSSDNLRGYPPSFETDQRPPIPGPIPRQYLQRPQSDYPNSNSNSRIPTSAPPSQSYQGFDPRVMRPNSSSIPSNSQSQAYPPNLYPYPAHPPPLHQRPPPPPPNPQNSQMPPQPIRRSSQDPRLMLPPQQPQEPPYIPDLSSVRPGEVIQAPPRRQSDGSSISAVATIRPPAATLMRPVDPTLERKMNNSGGVSPLIGTSGGFDGGFDSERYPVVVSNRKEFSGFSGTTESIRKVSGESTKIGEGNLSPVGRDRDRVSPRDSGSSFASSTSNSSRQRHMIPALTPPVVPDEAPYGGLEDERNYQRSSVSSARSSTASGGPLTPAVDLAPAVQDIQLRQSLPASTPTYSDGFDDPIEDDSTWFPINQPIKSIQVSPPLAVVIESSPLSLPVTIDIPSLRSPGGLHLLEPSPEEAGSGTIRAHDWAESCLSSFPKEDEDTITNVSNPVPEFTVAAAIPIDIKSSPTLGDRLGTFVEDPAFYFPEKSVNTYPVTNEFDDDEETSTYLPGFGPTTPRPSIVSPTSPVGVSLRDEPSSRSPILDRHHKEKRPTLTLVTSESASPNNVKLPESTPSSTSSIISPVPTRTTPTRPRTLADGSNEGINTSIPTLPKSSPSTTPSPSTHNHSPPRRHERIRASPGSKRLSELSLSQLELDLESGDSLIGRHNSFASREKDWAFRPPVETVLEHLEDFFPEHDLDKPIFDAPSTPLPGSISEASLVTPPSSTTTTPSSPKPEELAKKNTGAVGLKYKKSIRHVAQNQRKSLLKAGAVASKVGTNGHHEHRGSFSSSVMRRKSTKLFGNRLEEVTARQIKQMDEPILENPNLEDPENFSFKWIKGELIGRGTFGHVYLAYNITAAEFIAVKQVELPKTRSDQADLRQQGMVASLKAEIELLKDLEHPKIVEYLGMEETIEHLSIFLEYVPGGSVGRIVRTHGKFEENIIKSFTYQILEGLEYLHSLGILHRDLKADNILCDHQGRCKISDFGTSKRSNDIYNNNANMSMQGSIFWMAPEVINNFKQGQGYSAKADIWSLGCVCLEMFAGRRPWSDDEAIQAMFKLGSERIPPPIPADVTLSKSASHFLGNCLSIDSEMRPRASQLMRHSFLALPDQWSFTDTSLYRAIAASGDELSFQ